MFISAIAAMDARRVIGFEGGIPWNIPGEQKLFKEFTVGKAVVMGRVTWESLPARYRPLPRRFNIVVSSTLKINDAEEGCVVVSSVEDAIFMASMLSGIAEVVFIGGQGIYEEAVQHCDYLYLTKINDIYPGDRYFPEINKSEWFTEEKRHFPLKDNGVEYNFYRMSRLY